MSVSFHSKEESSNLLKSWPTGFGWGHNRRNHMSLYRKNLSKVFFSRTAKPENFKYK
jgi:hypothetical protein